MICARILFVCCGETNNDMCKYNILRREKLKLGVSPKRIHLLDKKFHEGESCGKVRSRRENCMKSTTGSSKEKPWDVRPAALLH